MAFIKNVGDVQKLNSILRKSFNEEKYFTTLNNNRKKRHLVLFRLFNYVNCTF